MYVMHVSVDVNPTTATAATAFKENNEGASTAV